MNKFYTYESVRPVPTAVDVHKTSADPSLANIQITDALAMGSTIGHYGPVNSGGVNLYGTNGDLLLSTAFIPNATLSITRRGRLAGQIDVAGAVTVTGGSLAGLAIFSNPLYVQVAFDNILAIQREDIHSNIGRFTFFSQTGATQVPEPGSVALLLTGLAGLKRSRRKRTVCN